MIILILFSYFLLIFSFNQIESNLNSFIFFFFDFVSSFSSFSFSCSFLSSSLLLLLLFHYFHFFFSLLFIIDYKSLRSVFTSIRLETHELSVESLTSFYNNKNNNNKQNKKTNNLTYRNLNNININNNNVENKKELHIVCSESMKSNNIRNYLVQHIGEENVHTIYTSKHENSICFVSLIDQTFVEEILLQTGVKSCTVIPSELKIHESVMYLFGLIERDHSAFEQLNSRYHKKSLDLDLSQVKLVISNGIGVPHKPIPKSEIYLKVEELKHLLFQSSSPHLYASPSSHLYHLASLHTTATTTTATTTTTSTPSSSSSSHKNIWHKHADILSNYEKENLQMNSQTESTPSLHEQDICSFSKLSIENTDTSIILSQLHEVMNSEKSKACYASLLALLVTSNSVSDIRFRFPKKLFNNYIKGIIQKNSRQEVYPYTAVGLNGTGEIIGVGKYYYYYHYYYYIIGFIFIVLNHIFYFLQLQF